MPVPAPGRVTVVVNPVARGSRAAVETVRQACAATGRGDPVVLPTTVEEPGGPQAVEAVRRGTSRIVVVGGDGTVRHVAGALADEGSAGPGRPTGLGVVPAGTANLFARGAALPLRDLRSAAGLAVSGPARPTDLGRALLRTADGRTLVEPFLVVAGVGHDAATLAAVRPDAKHRLRWLAYFVPGLGRLGHPGHALTLELDGHDVDAGELWSLLAVNAARLPAGARVVPGAELDDGRLHVVLVTPRHVGDWARIAATGLRRVPAADHPALRYRSGRTLLVGSPEPVLAQVDGDVVPDIVGGELAVLPSALRVAR
ncbi:hypothetical protein BJF81_10005 [Ornithinimicrobium sp. CNJ-824]|uniref:diacylglycerol/lipid kinase family protein n=1 Tax=Ornithinimicrobium sp. CNJ-824 TaxID=1904966 RepID=UPI0009596547|nr:diacylglycerol kinase family protein [Ornithinimicrobium sp. CNJ-824]OLT23674.1 hypothetical protein BJF81_10005 [Ornithinimicrobium sp. CNJ-824]